MRKSKSWRAIRVVLAVWTGIWSGASADETAAGPALPNIVLIYADDLGFGDVSCYGAQSVQTPHIDRLAREGLRFTDAHSAAATCTPSRYALLTGEYAWRKPGTGVLPGDAALILEPGRATLPSLLQRAGYATGVVGKWHLGLGAGSVDWNAEIRPGPLEVGFGSSFIMAATGDRAPCVYVDGCRVAGLDPADPIRVSYREPFPGEPTGRTHPELLSMHPSHGHDQAVVNGISRIGHMSGGAAARWNDETMADVFTEHAVRFLEEHRTGPFFLYFALHDIHVPRVPHPRFRGTTGMGPRGDAIRQTDWCVGEVLGALNRLGLEESTLVIFTSDNGPVVDDGYRDEAVERLGRHLPAGPWRGGKYSAFEAGTRVPMIVRWPGKVEPGVSGALIGQVDYPATLASLAGVALEPGEAPDSADLRPAILGASGQGRQVLVEQAGTLAIRQGPWKYIAPSRGPRRNANVGIELGNAPEPQLYHLERDPGETVNLAAAEPGKTAELAALLEAEKSRTGGAR